MAHELLIITGMSGSGKSVAAKVMEDLDYFCVDNLPVVMLPDFLGLVKERNVAVVVDIRQPGFFEKGEDALAAIRESHEWEPKILFLDSDDQTLTRRYAESRRPHPLNQSSILKGLKSERNLLAAFRGEAEWLIDTSKLAPHELRQRLREFFSPRAAGGEWRLNINVMSFGFKHGLPLDAHMVLDMRFLPNPYWRPELRSLTGLDEPVAEFLRGLDASRDFLSHLRPMLSFLFQRLQKSDRQFFTLAIGCTGGQHRSVYTAQKVHEYLQEEGFQANITHRDMALLSQQHA